MSNSLKIIIDFVVLAVIYLAVFFHRWRAKEKTKLLVNTIMYIYVSLVLYFTLMPIVVSLPYIFNHPYKPMNLLPLLIILRADTVPNYTEYNVDDAVWFLVPL